MDASCQCGDVSFKTPLKKPLALYMCHCEECRRQSGSAFGCSAIFPKFPLPCREKLSLYSRPTASGAILNCYFCKSCGTRIIHSTPGKEIVSIKGGCIVGLDWSNAHHIWTRHAMVPIPEGVETSYEEPENEDYSGVLSLVQSDGGSGKSTPNPLSKSKSLFSSKPYDLDSEKNDVEITFVDSSGKVYPEAKSTSPGSGQGSAASSKSPNLDDVLSLNRFTLGKGKDDDEIRG